MTLRGATPVVGGNRSVARRQQHILGKLAYVAIFAT
jgi:hypothetical protein